MRKLQYGKKLLQNEECGNIFAVMYLSAQIENLRLFSERIHKIRSGLTRTVFLNFDFVDSLSECLHEIKDQAQEIDNLINLSLQILPDHELGVRIRMTTKYIFYKIDREIDPAIDRYRGKPDLPARFANDLSDLSRVFQHLANQLQEVKSAINQAAVKKKDQA